MFRRRVSSNSVVQPVKSAIRLLLICLAVALLVRGLVVSARKFMPESRTQQDRRVEPASNTPTVPDSPKARKTRLIVVRMEHA